MERKVLYKHQLETEEAKRDKRRVAQNGTNRIKLCLKQY